jgi:hypothetical protein
MVVGEAEREVFWKASSMFLLRGQRRASWSRALREHKEPLRCEPGWINTFLSCKTLCVRFANEVLQGVITLKSMSSAVDDTLSNMRLRIVLGRGGGRHYRA